MKRVLALSLFLLLGCGKNTVTLTLIPAGAQVGEAKNLMKQLTSLPNTLSLQGFCKQPEVLAGLIYGINSLNANIQNLIPVAMNTNLTDWGTPGPSFESLVAQELNNPSQTTYDAPIRLTVPRGESVRVGMIGKINLGASQNGYCKEAIGSGGSTSAWNYN